MNDQKLKTSLELKDRIEQLSKLRDALCDETKKTVYHLKLISDSTSLGRPDILNINPHMGEFVENSSRWIRSEIEKAQKEFADL